MTAPTEPTDTRTSCVNKRCNVTDHLGERPLIDTRFCNPCRKSIRADLLELADLYVKLHCELEPSNQVTMNETRRTKQPAAPAPLNVMFSSLMDDLVKVITGFADDVREARHKARIPTGREQRRRGPLLTESIDYLASNLHWALEVYDKGDKIGLKILDLNLEARTTLGETRYVKTFEIPCPDCGEESITQAAGTDVVQCQGCGGVWTRKVLDAWIHRYELQQQA